MQFKNIHHLATTLQLLPAEINNTDWHITGQCSARNPQVLASMDVTQSKHASH